MITTSIRQRVRDNLNRDDAGIDTKIQDWLQDTKRRIEQRVNIDYMRSVPTTAHTNALPSQAIPTGARLKDIISVKFRKTLPAAEAESTWTVLPILSEAEVLQVESFEGSPLAVTTGSPVGYTLEESNITVHPKPETGKTYTLSIVLWLFSADWTFGGAEEPYLAKFAWQALIAGGSGLGFAFLGEHGDADRWDQKFEKFLQEFIHHEMARALEGEISLRPMTRPETRPSRAGGWNAI